MSFACKCKGKTFVLETVVTVEPKDIPNMTTPENQLRCTGCGRLYSATDLTEKEKK